MMMFALGWTAALVAAALRAFVREKMRLHALHNMQAPARTDPDQLTLL